MKSFILYFLMLLGPFCGFAATITSNGTGGGDWSQGTSWSGGVVPADGDEIIIAAGDVIRIDGTPDITLNNVTVIIHGTLNMDDDGFSVGNLNLNGTSGLFISSTGSITESVGAFGEGFSSITLNGVVLWTACSNPVCVAIVNAAVEPDPEVNGPTTPGSGGLLLPASGNPLPVEIIFFSAHYENKNVILTWSTASEENNSHFEVERSYDAENFTFIGVVEGNGTTDRRTDYEFFDPEIQSPRNPYVFYRLRQVDFDGAFEYTNLIAAKNEALDPSEVLVSPNPFSESLMITLTSPADDEVSITVHDMKGSEVFTGKYRLYEGRNDVPIEGLGKLQSGVYVITLSGSYQLARERVVKMER